MKISEKNFNKIFHVFLCVIAVSIIFRKPCSILIIIFGIFNLFYVKRLKFNQKALILVLCIASTLLLEILLFWNNDSFSKGFKALEKSISLLLFPIFVIGNFERIQFLKLIKIYSTIMSILMLFFFVRFNIIYPELLTKYLNGIDLWEVGYKFSESIGIHAPALNMHLAFVSISSLYFVFLSFKNNEKAITKGSLSLLFLMSFFFVLFVNTRMALFNALAGFIIVFFFEIKSHFSIKKIIIIGVTIILLLSGILFLFVQNNPYMKEKYSTVTFAYIDKVGKLDEIDHPEIKVFNSFVTRLSIWKSAWELSVENLPFGVGASDGKPELFKYYRDTNQQFLAKYEFPTHNQFLDFLLKFGFLGPLVVILYIGTIGYLGFDLKNAIIISFFFLFFTSNLTDDFLLRFDGIVFSGFWSSVFAGFWLQQKAIYNKDPEVV